MGFLLIVEKNTLPFGFLSSIDLNEAFFDGPPAYIKEFDIVVKGLTKYVPGDSTIPVIRIFFAEIFETDTLESTPT